MTLYTNEELSNDPDEHLLHAIYVVDTSPNKWLTDHRYTKKYECIERYAELVGEVGYIESLEIFGVTRILTIRAFASEDDDSGGTLCYSASGDADPLEESPHTVFTEAQKLALEGSPAAQLELAHYYRGGYGVEADLYQAQVWYTASGLLDWSGRAYALILAGDVSKDRERYTGAHRLYFLAALAGAESGTERLAQIRDFLTNEEIAQAEQHAEEIADQFGIGRNQDAGD